MKRIVEFAHKHQVNIRLAYYPPYHSKYNPIERTWAVLENHWNGSILDELETVYSYFQRWQRKGIWQKIHSVLRCLRRATPTQLRQLQGRDVEPSAGVIDSQTVKTTEKGGIDGYDAGKKINGRKRHILVDTMGLLLMVVVHAASIQDRDRAKLVLDKIQYSFPKLHLIWADGGYAGSLVDWVRYFIGCAMEIVKRSDDTLPGHDIIPFLPLSHNSPLANI